MSQCQPSIHLLHLLRELQGGLEYGISGLRAELVLGMHGGGLLGRWALRAGGEGADGERRQEETVEWIHFNSFQLLFIQDV